MAATILQIMRGIETRLATISSLRVSDTVPDQINPKPAGGYAIVGVPPIPQYHQTMGMGRYRIQPTVTVLTSSALDRVGQEALVGFAAPTGDTSIRAAIEADQTLGGIAEVCVVEDFRPLGLEEVGAIGYYGGVFGLLVVASGV